jgi:hypothetical protein
MFHLSRGARTALAAIILTGTALIGGQAAHAFSLATAISLPGLNIGVSHSLSEPSWVGYYDGHKDTYTNDDVSDKGQATSLKINFAPTLTHGLNASSPMYFVKGRAAAGQIAVFGSEPGEKDYSPLWREIWVTWKSGVKPVLLVRDDQVNGLVAKGKLTEKTTMIVLNAPIKTVGH